MSPMMFNIVKLGRQSLIGYCVAQLSFNTRTFLFIFNLLQNKRRIRLVDQCICYFSKEIRVGLGVDGNMPNIT